jgi:hypothetical protein
MCENCGCGEKKEKIGKIYECKKCGKTSKEQKFCCGKSMVEKKK